MGTAASPQSDSKVRIDIYALVTDKIIEQLKNGTVPWRKPWTDAGIPRNAISGKPYKGINSLLLGMEQYNHNLFLTFDQVRNVGGKVKKDSKGHMVVYWHKPKETNENEGVETEKKKGFLRYYTVFNIEQCEKIPERYLPSYREPELIPKCEDVIQKMPKSPRIQHKDSLAYYHVIEDFVNMPKRRTFKTNTGYYATLFHELVHSTGHDSRLARQGVVEMSEFGSEQYSLEELVAEIGTCYLLSLTNITCEFQNSTAYIHEWLKKLHDDKRLILKAGSEAQKAVDYILNTKLDKNDVPDEVE